MARVPNGWENRAMKTEPNTTERTETPANPGSLPIGKPQREIDPRDETIRLLNQGLSHALDELSALSEAA